MKKILAIDPGPEQSAYVIWDTEERAITSFGQLQNDEFLQRARSSIGGKGIVAIEDVVFYGKVLNKSTFDTLKLIGRLMEIYSYPGNRRLLVKYPDVAYHFCNSRQGVKQSQINAVLTDRFGEKGTKKAPGITHGLKEHIWSAFAIAVYVEDTIR